MLICNIYNVNINYIDLSIYVSMYLYYISKCFLSIEFYTNIHNSIASP